MRSTLQCSKRALWLLICSCVITLSACGTTEIIKNVNGTYTVSAQYGSINGSWDRASKDANEKALIYCEGAGKDLLVINERREGVWGFSPQRAEVNFKCVPKNSDISVEPAQKESMEQQLDRLKSLYEKGLLTKDQYDFQVNRVMLNSQ